MATLKQLKRLLKKAGLKSSGSKRALTRRAKKAHVLRGGQEPEVEGGGRTSRRRHFTFRQRPMRQLTASAYRW